MLEQITEKFDEKFFKKWKSLTEQTTKDLEKGLAKIEISPPIPKNLELIYQDIQKAKKAETDAEYIAAMTNLQRHLDRLVKYHQFNNPDVNIFFIQARRTYGNLLSFTFRSMLNDYNKYMAAFTNPAAKDLPKQFELGAIPMRFVSKATKLQANKMLHDARKEVVDTFSAQAENLSKKPHLSTYGKNTNKELSHCFLERQMGEKNYFESNQDALISSPEEASMWLGREIYRLGYDHFYTQCAQLYEAYVKVESIASLEQNKEDATRKKQDLLRELQMEELGSQNSMNYLNKMAQHLGFSSIQKLHQNFRELNSENGFKEYNERKQHFTSYAEDMDIEAPDDPLEQLKKTAREEYERSKAKMDDPKYQEFSMNYSTAVMTSGLDFINGTTNSQRTKNIAISIAEDFITSDYLSAKVGLDEGGALSEKLHYVKMAASFFGKAGSIVSSFMNTLAEKTGTQELANAFTTDLKNYGQELVNPMYVYADGVLKNQLRNKLLFCMKDERFIEERRISSITKELDHKWLEIRKEQLNNANKAHEEMIKKVDTISDMESLEQNLIIRMQTYDDSLKNLAKIDKTKNRDEFSVLQTTSIALEKEYSDYSTAFNFKMAKQIRKMSSAELLLFIEDEKQKIVTLSDSADKLAKKINTTKEEESRFHKAEGRIGGRLIRWRDNFVGLFGYKTKTAQKREDRIKKYDFNIKALTHDLEAVQLEHKIHHSLIARAEEQHRQQLRYKEISPIQLVGKLDLLSENHLDQYAQIMKCYELSSKGDNIIAKLDPLREKYLLSSSNLLSAANALLEKLNDTNTKTDLADNQLASLIKLRDSVSERRNTIATFKDVMPISEEKERMQLLDSLTLVENNLDDAIKIGHQLAEQKNLDELKSKAYNFITTQNNIEIHDPFTTALKNIGTINLNSEKSKIELFKKIGDTFISFLDKNAHNIDRRELETLVLELHRGYYRNLPEAQDDKTSLALCEDYKHVINKINELLTEKYQAILRLDSEAQREALVDLDADYITHFRSILFAKENLTKTQNSFDSWLRNPFGLITTETALYDAEINVMSQSDLFQAYSNRYLTILKQYIIHVPQWINTLDRASLNAHIKRLEKEYLIIEGIAQELNDPVTLEIQHSYSKLINIVKNAEKEHYDYLVDEIDDFSEEMNSKISELEKFAEELDRGLIANEKFDTAIYLSFEKSLNEINDFYKTINEKITRVDQQHEHTYRNNLNVSQAVTQWAHRKADIQRKLNVVMGRVTSRQENEYNAYQFYHEIAIGKATSLPALNPKQFGMAAILALQNNNISLTNKIIDNAGSRISINHLSQVLNLAIEKGDMPLVKKIFECRNDISYNNADILSFIATAINNEHSEIASYLLLNSNVKLNRDATELLQGSIFAQESTLSPVQGSSLFFDNDSIYLDYIRDCYAFQMGMLNQLNTEFNALRTREGALRDKTDPLYPAFEADLKNFMKKVDTIQGIGSQMLSFYINSGFKKPERREEHIKKWATPLNEIYSLYREGFSNFQPGTVQAFSADSGLSSKTQAIKNKILSSIDKGLDLPNLILELTALKSRINQPDQNQYYQILSESINYAAQKGETRSLDILLSIVEDPARKNEYAFNALLQTLSTKQYPAFKYLIDSQYFAQHEREFVQKLYNQFHSEAHLVDGRNDSFTHKAILQTLSHVPVPYEDHIREMVDSIAQDTIQSEITPLTKGNWQRFVSDADGPTIEKIRSVYVFAEQAFNSAHDVYLSIRNPFSNLLIERELTELTLEEIREYEVKIQQAKDNLSHQHYIINELIENHSQYVLDNASPISNKPRLQRQVEIWNGNLRNVIDLGVKKFNDDIRYIEAQLKQYHDTQKQSQDQPKRRSLLFVTPETTSIKSSLAKSKQNEQELDPRKSRKLIDPSSPSRGP